MSKPSWSDAPDWAQWLAMDYSGLWYWYKYKPVIIGGFPRWSASIYALAAAPSESCASIDWRESLEQRPQEEPPANACEFCQVEETLRLIMSAIEKLPTSDVPLYDDAIIAVYYAADDAAVHFLRHKGYRPHEVTT